MKLKYIESDIGKKKLKNAKIVDLVYLITFILVTINYIILCLDTKKINGIIVFSIIYIIVSLFIRLIKKRHISRVITEMLVQEICLDGFINLHIYNAKKAQKSLSNKAYNYSLLNLIDGYFRKGDFDQTNDIIKVLEKRQLDDTVKAFLIRYKASIAYNRNNKEEFYTQYRKFEEISNSITEKIKNQILIPLDLQKNMLENNESEVNKICEQLINNKLLLNKVMGYYYKGVILEKNNKEEYKECYKFVVENGNDLNIAKIASEKTGIAQQIKYKAKRHIGFKIFTSLLFIIIAFSTIFIGAFYIEYTKMKWDTGIVYINNRKVELPCSISKFEETMNVEIDVDKISPYGFYNLYLGQNYFNIELFIEDNNITGVKVDISNGWNDELDVDLGNVVVFPEKITANSSIEEIQVAYKTGIINPAMREWSEEIENGFTKEIIHSYGFKYSGDKYDISIDCKNGKVKTIFYYYTKSYYSKTTKDDEISEIDETPEDGERGSFNTMDITFYKYKVSINSAVSGHPSGGSDFVTSYISDTYTRENYKFEYDIEIRVNCIKGYINKEYPNYSTMGKIYVFDKEFKYEEISDEEIVLLYKLDNNFYIAINLQDYSNCYGLDGNYIYDENENILMLEEYDFLEFIKESEEFSNALDIEISEE